VNDNSNSSVMGEEFCFLGEFEHSLDTQRRIAIPSQWRNSDGGNRFILIPGRNRILQLIPYESFKENFLSRAKKVSIADAEGARALATLGSRAQECVCDKQGRIQVGQKLLEYAGLKEGVILIGAVSTIQIWDVARWREQPISDESYFDEVQKISESPDDFVNMMKGTLDRLK